MSWRYQVPGNKTSDPTSHVTRVQVFELEKCVAHRGGTKAGQTYRQQFVHRGIHTLSRYKYVHLCAFRKYVYICTLSGHLYTLNRYTYGVETCWYACARVYYGLSRCKCVQLYVHSVYWYLHLHLHNDRSMSCVH